MHRIRTLLATAGLGAVVGLTGACENSSVNATTRAGFDATAPDAHDAWVEVDPGTVSAGNRITVNAECGDSHDSATVRSDAFGTVTVRSSTTRLSASVQVPVNKGDGTYVVVLSCRSGTSATTTLVVLPGARGPKSDIPDADQTMGPHTGGGFLAHSPAEPDQRHPWLLGGAGALLAAALLGALTLRGQLRPRPPTTDEPDRRPLG